MDVIAPTYRSSGGTSIHEPSVGESSAPTPIGIDTTHICAIRRRGTAAFLDATPPRMPEATMVACAASVVSVVRTQPIVPSPSMRLGATHNGASGAAHGPGFAGPLRLCAT